MAARKLVSRLAKGVAGLLGAVLFVVAVEYQVFAYAASVIRHGIKSWDISAHAATTPEDVLAAYAGADQRNLSFLATGDIARCARTDLAGRFLPATSEQLGLRGSMAPDQADAGASAAFAAKVEGLPILAVGDLVYTRGTPGEFADCFNASWGGLRDRILPAPGNHEYGTPGAFGYFDYWDAQAGPDRRGYYALRWRNWLILSLNSEVDAAPGSPQAAWLTQELAKAPDVCIMAFFHKPAHSLQGARHGMESAAHLFALLQRAGGSFVINGHNHFYERTQPVDAMGTVDVDHGMIGFTVGTGGIQGPATHEAALRAQTAAAIFGTIGLLRVQLSDTGFTWWFHQAADGVVMDHGMAPCSKKGHVI
jgi:acid phosphatase type 7